MFSSALSNFEKNPKKFQFQNLKKSKLNPRKSGNQKKNPTKSTKIHQKKTKNPKNIKKMVKNSKISKFTKKKILFFKKNPKFLRNVFF